MSKAVYVQRGEKLDYLNSTDKKIEAGTILELKTRIGIAGGDIELGAWGSVELSGVYEMPKTGTVAIEMGTALYFDGEGITDAADDGAASGAVSYVPAGIAAADSAAGDATVKVRLPG